MWKTRKEMEEWADRNEKWTCTECGEENAWEEDCWPTCDTCGLLLEQAEFLAEQEETKTERAQLKKEKASMLGHVLGGA